MLNQLNRLLWIGACRHLLQVAFHNGMMMALYIHNVFVIEHTHAAASVFGADECEEHIICEDLVRILVASHCCGILEFGWSYKDRKENSHIRGKYK